MALPSHSGDSDMESSDNDDYDDYYPHDNVDDKDIESNNPKEIDPEYFAYECLMEEQVERLLNETVERLSANLQIAPSLAKILLLNHKWREVEIIEKHKKDPVDLLVSSKIKPPGNPPALTIPRDMTCPVCVVPQTSDKFFSLSCSHMFCKDCWATHFEVQINQGISTAISCMARECVVLAPEDFVLKHLSRQNMREKYQQFTFRDYVKSHPALRFCPGPRCSIIVRSDIPKAERVVCSHCKIAFCFLCGTDYHPPNDCSLIKKWLRKCVEDGKTSNYISTYTKDCPKCHACIEKNGGCNNMRCFKCQFQFCWMCLRSNEGMHTYSGCSMYRENAQESVQSQGRAALNKYLHYYSRWENHSKSLKLEEQTMERLRTRINEKVMSGREGTWIDWKYLLAAGELLAKCRYTLQYTYPYAYYMAAGPRKQLFEHQQAQLEVAIENLSWKIERAETTDRGDIESQMDIAKKRQTTLLKDFQ